LDKERIASVCSSVRFSSSKEDNQIPTASCSILDRCRVTVIICAVNHESVIWQRMPSKNSRMPNNCLSCQPRHFPLPSAFRAYVLRELSFAVLLFKASRFHLRPGGGRVSGNLQEHTLHSYPRRVSISISLRSADLAARGFAISAFTSSTPFWEDFCRVATPSAPLRRLINLSRSGQATNVSFSSVPF
jgi:hypothetical protein